jgi:hypothetical protein
MLHCHRLACALAGLGLALGLAPRHVTGQAAATVSDTSHSGSVHPSPSPLAAAARRAAPIVLDGRLDEAAWQAATPAVDFTQAQPNEGQPATQRTEVRFLYDDEALYVGARMYDTEGAAGVRTRLVRRDDNFNSDYIELIFDTFHDHLSRVEFMTNPSGSKEDSYGPNGSNLDASWDAVWDVATRIDSMGWTAEFRIPLSQLRFPRDSMQTWGLQIWRGENRLNEVSQWSFWHLNEAGGPARFGHLQGLALSRGPGRAEIMPYVVGRSANLSGLDPADPFHRPHQSDARVGGDFKYYLASNLTLSGTINPDFGQVEVDPAVVNLSAFETFFPEKRPFFVEGGGLFAFGSLNCFFCSNTGSVNLFYPRRIGRAPQGAGNAYSQGQWADVPDNTRILGAAKLTGRVGTGWTVATLDALTAREMAPVADTAGHRLDVEVEPLTNYFVGRFARDLSGGSYVRGIVTSVVRDLRDSTLRTQLSAHSEAAGVETNLWWARRTWHFMGYADVTQVSGDPAAILRVQRASARYFQRPDRSNGANGLFSDGFDSTLTSLRGYALYSRVAKDAGDWMWEASANVRSPGLEANDVAFNTQSDRIWMSTNLARQYTRPGWLARSAFLILGGQQAYNFSRDLVDRQVQVHASLTLNNYWFVSAFAMYRPGRLDDQLARGGPVLGRAAQTYWSGNVVTDSRRAVYLGSNGDYYCADGRCSWDLAASATFKPASNVQLSLGPSYGVYRTRNQYVTTVADPAAVLFYGNRYVFADLFERTLAMDTRLNVTFSPTLTLQLYAQPLIVSGAYSAFKEFDRPRTLDRSVYGVDKGTITLAGGTYTVDPDGPGGAAPFTFAAPDFNFRSLRGSAVLRWEYRPGSTVFFVWTQSRSGSASVGDLDLERDAHALFSAPSDNIFMVKFNYWMGF